MSEGIVTYSHAAAGHGMPRPQQNQHQEEYRQLLHFILTYRESEHDEVIYREQLIRNYNLRKYYIEVNLSHLAGFNEDLCQKFFQLPNIYIEVFEKAARDALQRLVPPPRDKSGQETNRPFQDIQVQLISENNPMPIRQLLSNHVSKLVKIPGIVISTGKIVPRPIRLCIRCRGCHDIRLVTTKSGMGSSDMPKHCMRNSDLERAGRAVIDDGDRKCPAYPYQILTEHCVFVDQQIVKLQEHPETIPTGEMPRHVTLLVDRSILGLVVPGTRVSVTGVSMIYASASARAMGDIAVRHPYLRVVGYKVDEEGAGRVSNVFTPEEVTEFKGIARKPDIYELITKSMAPAIYGHEDIKRSLACQLFGGCRKTLPDGVSIRGDINVLLLGDPGTAKSQLLKFVEKVAPIGVYTSGKGSSAAGLTASVVRNPSTREFYLEGGAMVLADGGIVCIDEFDKMRSQDRVAIHEAMEQQTISIAKAGITTVLNSRSAVTAAANPSFGAYDEMRSAAENFTEFRSTILSRFDCIFLIKDIRDERRDRTIAQHVVNLHMAGNVIKVDGEIQLYKLKRYIYYCRENCFPRLTEPAADLLANHYVGVRKQYRQRERSGEENAIPITIRQLEAIVRLSEALAKMSMQPIATEEHVREAIRLFTVSTIEATNSGKVVLERMNEATRQEVEAVETLIKKKLAIESSTRAQSLIASLVKTFNISELSVRRAINLMVQKEELEYRMRRQIIFRRR